MASIEKIERRAFEQSESSALLKKSEGIASIEKTEKRRGKVLM